MCALVFLTGVGVRSYAFAEDKAREELLLRVLATSPSFRVRAQAAVALSHMPSGPRVLSALRACLKDPDTNVKEACTAALASLDSSRDKSPRQGTSSGKYYVHVGEPSAKTTVPRGSLSMWREHVISLVAKLDGVRLAPELEQHDKAMRVIAREGLIGFSVESIVNSMEKRGDSVHVSVSVVVSTYPGRDIRAMLTGSASVSGSGTGEETQRQATAAAFSSALRKLPNVLDSSRLEASASPSEAGRTHAPRQALSR